MRLRALALMFLAACGSHDLGAPRFPLEQCASLPLVDTDDRPIVGAEDLAIGPLGDTVFLSAHDRFSDAPGGMYSLQLNGLEQRAQGVPEKIVVRTVEGYQGTIRPHGLDVGAEGVIAIDRRPSQNDRLVGADQWGARYSGQSPDDNRFCTANDVLVADDVLYVSHDRAQCQPGWLGRVLSPADGRVEKTADGVHFDLVRGGMQLANGLARWGEEIWVAEMRRKRIIRLSDGAMIDLPGAPDNLTTSAEGLVVSVEPSLWRFGLFRYGWAKRAPTRIVRVDPDTRGVELLFDDPAGALYSGATAAVLAGRLLVATSVVGDRLLLCRDEL